MAMIKDYLPSSLTQKSKPKKRIGFLESSTKFGKVHKYLIEKGIVDGSSNSLVEDLLDEKLAGVEAVETILKKLSGIKTEHSLTEKLVYIALGGFFKLEISMRIRKALEIQEKKLRKAINDEEFDIGYSLIKGSENEIQVSDLKKAIEMRLRAIRTVAKLHGAHFFKRAYHVSDGWKIPLEDVRKG